MYSDAILQSVQMLGDMQLPEQLSPHLQAVTHVVLSAQRRVVAPLWR